MDVALPRGALLTQVAPVVRASVMLHQLGFFVYLLSLSCEPFYF